MEHKRLFFESFVYPNHHHLGNKWYLHLLYGGHVDAQLEALDQRLYLCSCQDLEKLNLTHTRLICNCVQKYRSSVMLLENQLLQFYYLKNPELCFKTKKQKKRRTAQPPNKGCSFATKPVNEFLKESKESQVE